MEKLPFDITINYIIPYTYNIQPKSLLEDIKNYHTVKSILINDKYKTDIIKHELLARYYCINNKQKINNILNRHYLSNLKNYDYNILYKYSQNTKFNILFGLLTEEERTSSSEYIFKEFSNWIIK
jgi:hypothetical protein